MSWFGKGTKKDPYKYPITMKDLRQYTAGSYIYFTEMAYNSLKAQILIKANRQNVTLIPLKEW